MMDNKRIIACDLDDTLADTKRPIEPRMVDLLTRLLDSYDLCVITGGRYAQVEANVLSLLDLTPDKLSRIHAISTSGAQYNRYDPETGKWELVYRQNMPDDERQRIAARIEEIARAEGLWESEAVGDIIEDRLTQVTFSGMGQLASPEVKAAWDPSGEKRQKLRTLLAEEFEGYEVAINGKTSIDVLDHGIDKAYGINKLMEYGGYQMNEVLFIGDSLGENGNDYPVKAMGIDTIAVTKWQETADYMEENLL